MPTVPVIVVGVSERVDEDGYMLVSERSVVLPKEMRTLHYTEAIEQARNPLKSAKTDNHIVKILSQEEFDKLGGGQEPIVAKEYEANLKSLTINDAQLRGFTNRPGEITLQWESYSNGTYTSNRYRLIRNGETILENYQSKNYIDNVPPNDIYNYVIEYYYNDNYLNEDSNFLSLHSSHRSSGGNEYIDRLYASHNMVVDLEGWWVSEIEIKWDILIGNADGTVTEAAKSINQIGGAQWETKKGDGSRFVSDDKDVDLFNWYKSGNAGYTYTIRLLEDDGGTNEESVDVWVDVIALVAETALTAAGKLEVVALTEAAKPSIKKIIKNLRKDD